MLIIEQCPCLPHFAKEGYQANECILKLLFNIPSLLNADKKIPRIEMQSQRLDLLCHNGFQSVEATTPQHI
jgi:hypothetical protein